VAQRPIHRSVPYDPTAGMPGDRACSGASLDLVEVWPEFDFVSRVVRTPTDTAGPSSCRTAHQHELSSNRARAWRVARDRLSPPLESSCVYLVATINNDIGDSSGVVRIWYAKGIRLARNRA
jgi:hypothetical protein